METILGAVGSLIAGLLRSLAFYSVFYAIGSVALKLLTLGRYPRFMHMREDARRGFPEFELVALFGLLCTIGLVVLLARAV
ncbi:hypothetical protein J8I26_14910 [Herbaspirillum sp. LeCh32-8]|uniref:hypothetical protein n=1 Tax=Herbaspirillum sp. LeCh32-8 TaxID=2821356 RepID=UPI001AE27704|nr:hypothetical protein [Herbaspirillum sp. LeCh32-8]MBP0599405.1 hypothetical protein [Herbaspirillum sp. LeCh32-8]